MGFVMEGSASYMHKSSPNWANHTFSKQTTTNPSNAALKASKYDNAYLVETQYNVQALYLI